MQWHLRKLQFELPERTVRDKIACNTWSKKLTVLSTFLEFSLNFLSNNLKKHYNIWNSQGEKRCQNLNFSRKSLKGQSGDKIACKTHLD